MIKTHLTPCASLLYHWIQLHSPEKQPLLLNLRDFQAWTGEFLEKSASMNEIELALVQLKGLDLIEMTGNSIVKVNNGAVRRPVKVTPLPKFILGKATENKFFAGLCWLLFSLFVVGSYGTLFSFQLSQNNRETPIQLHPYQVLGEKDIQ